MISEYERGFRAGLEAAAKLFDDAAYDVRWLSKLDRTECAEAIRAIRAITPAPCPKCAFEGDDPVQCEKRPCPCSCHAPATPSETAALDAGQRAWVLNSIKHHVAEERTLASRARKAYRGHYAAPANMVAEVHERCAELWQALVSKAEPPATPPAALLAEGAELAKAFRDGPKRQVQGAAPPAATCPRCDGVSLIRDDDGSRECPDCAGTGRVGRAT